jgi:hypothetical protein
VPRASNSRSAQCSCKPPIRFLFAKLIVCHIAPFDV